MFKNKSIYKSFLVSTCFDTNHAPILTEIMLNKILVSITTTYFA